MFVKLIYILPVLTLVFFFAQIFFKGNTVQACLLFILSSLPLMDLKITSESWGGFKTFDFICFYCFLFLFKDFTIIKLKSGNNLYFFLFALFFITILLSGFTSDFPNRTYLNLFKVLPIFIFARFLITEVNKDPSFHMKAIDALKVSYILAICFLFIQTIVGLKFTFYPFLARNTVDPVFQIIRYPGVFYDSQGHGQFLAMGSFIFLLIQPNSSTKKRIVNYSFFVLCIVGIALAGSRAAFGGFAVGLFIVFVMAANRYRIYGSILMVLVIVFFLFFSPKTGVFNRTENLTEDYLFRESIWKEALEISKENPLLGIGLGNYQSYIIRHAQNQYLEIENGELVYFDQPENGYLKILVELGFIGFTIFVLFLLLPLKRGFISWKNNGADRNVVFLMASLASWVIAFNTVYSISDYRLLIMVVAMIILISSYRHTKFDSSNG
jgi:O-antigen ligase